MTKPVIRKIYWSMLGIMLGATLFFSPSFEIPMLDKKADTYFTESISKAGIAYATCRLINGSVSIIQNSNLSLEPAGVGVSLALGQILDPLDDMTERLSDVLVTAIVALGAQKLVHEISMEIAPVIIAVFLVILSILIWFNNQRIKSFQRVTIKIIFIVMILRFCLPISSILNDYLYAHFFEAKITHAKQELSLATVDLDRMKTFSLPEIDGLLGTIKNSASLVIDKSIALKDALACIKKNLNNIISNLILLTTLYVGIFIIQVLILPLLIFLLLVKTANSLFAGRIPVILHTHGKEKQKPVKIT